MANQTGCEREGQDGIGREGWRISKFPPKKLRARLREAALEELQTAQAELDRLRGPDEGRQAALDPEGARGSMSGLEADGRTPAVKLLQEIYGLNDSARQDVRQSRDLMVAALEKFRDLPERERIRFATILNDTIAATYAGIVFNPAIYDHGRPEVTHMRMVTKNLRAAERAREAGAAP